NGLGGAEAYIEQGIYSSFVEVGNFINPAVAYKGQYDYNGTLYDFSGVVATGGYSLLPSTFTLQTFTSLNTIFIRVDGIDRVDITTTHGVSNPKIIGQSFTHND